MDRNNWWSIYPIGYFLVLGGGVDATHLTQSITTDLVKFLFGLVIWYAAMMDSG